MPRLMSIPTGKEHSFALQYSDSWVRVFSVNDLSPFVWRSFTRRMQKTVKQWNEQDVSADFGAQLLKKTIPLSHVAISLGLRTHCNDLSGLAIQEQQQKTPSQTYIFSYIISPKNSRKTHWSKLFEQVKYDEERLHHPLTYHFPCMPSKAKWSPQIGVARKGFPGSLADKQLYFRRLQRQECLTTLTSLSSAWKQFSCHTAIPKAAGRAQLYILYVHRLQSINKTKVHKMHTCMLLPWMAMGRKKGTLTVRSHDKSTSSTIPIHLSPLRWENAERMQAEVTGKVIFFSCWHIPWLLQRQFSKRGACSHYCSWCGITGQLRLKLPLNSIRKEASDTFFCLLLLLFSIFCCCFSLLFLW